MSRRVFLVSIIFLNILRAPLSHGQIVINEFMSENEGDFQDASGNTYDWVELYNTTDSVVNLLGYSITDDIILPDKFVFDDIQIAPRGWLLLMASGESKSDELIHLNFKIDKDGETLLLFDPDGHLIDKVLPEEVKKNTSYGRIEDGAPEFIHFRSATPNYSNGLGERYTYAEKLGLSVPPGFYTDSVDVALEGSTDLEIRYTLDGSLPNIHSPVYDQVIRIKNRSHLPNIASDVVTWPTWSPWPGGRPNRPVQKCTIIRARGFKDGKAVTSVLSASYFVFNKADNNFTLPVISLITDADNLFDDTVGILVPGISFKPSDPFSGNYSNRGMQWEREANFEYFDNKKQRQVSQLVGIRVKGNSSQIIPNKSLRISARHQYGNNEIHYPFFNDGIEVFERLVLKPAGQDFHLTFMRDVLANQMARNMGLDFQNHSAVILFINGEYWGINFLREHLDENYIAAHYHVNKNDVTVEEHSAAFQNFIDYISGNDLSDPVVYEQVAQQLDIENYILYTLHEIFTLRWDYMNRIPWKTNGGKWRFLTSDYDAAFGGPCSVSKPERFDYISYLLKSDRPCLPTSYPCAAMMCQSQNSNILIRKLMQNANFRLAFITAARQQLTTTFDPANLHAALFDLVAILDPEMDQHIARWHAPGSRSSWMNETKKVKHFFEIRSCEVRKHIAAHLRLFHHDFGEDNCALPTVSADGELPSKTFVLYPNPSEGTLHIAGSSPSQFSITLYDGKGIIHLTKTVHDYEPIDLKGLSSGMYFAFVVGPWGERWEKVIIARP